MKIRTQLDRGTRNLLMMSQCTSLYQYGVDGIYLNAGPYKGTNLNTLYSENSENCLNYLDNIIDNEQTPYKLKVVTKQVQMDLINNYYNL